MYCKNGSLVQTAWPLRTAGLSHVSPPTLSKDLSLWDTWNTRQAECHHTLQASSDGALACFLWFFDKLCKTCALLNNDAVQKPDSQILVVGITSGYSKWRRARWEHQQCRVWSKRPWWWLWSEEAAKSFFPQQAVSGNWFISSETLSKGQHFESQLKTGNLQENLHSQISQVRTFVRVTCTTCPRPNGKKGRLKRQYVLLHSVMIQN